MKIILKEQTKNLKNIKKWPFKISDGKTATFIRNFIKNYVDKPTLRGFAYGITTTAVSASPLKTEVLWKNCLLKTEGQEWFWVI